MAIITELRHIVIFVILLNLVAMPIVGGQRPSFAGSRPPNGGNQKDKYTSTTTTTSTATSGDGLQNRFGAPEAPISNQIPFGQTQKPPVGLVVTPESAYVPLVATSNSVAFEDRFGEVDKNGSSSAAVIPSATPPPGHPFDAHGDTLLIEKLNKLPLDQRPFWFINYQAIEAQRNATSGNFASAQSPRGSFSG